ncbi:MAG TPA: hypothetical protein VF868_15535 [Bacteroidia bacterium]
MKTKYIFFITSAVILGLSSCTTSTYVSNNVNTPLLKEQGEVKLTVDQNNLQVAVGVTDNIGLMVNGFSKSYQGKEYFKHNGKLGEIGLGYYLPFKKNMIFETYAGVGAGNLEKKVSYTNHENTVITNSWDARGSKAFIQPSIGYCNKYIELAFTPRFSFVKYKKFNSIGFSEAELAADHLDNGKLTSGIFTFAEPALTLRFGYKFFKIQAQYGRTINIGRPEIAHGNDFGSIGFTFDIAKWYRTPARKTSGR